MNILQISTKDMGGGAENIAYALFKAYGERKHNSWLAVGSKRSDTSGVLEISSNRGQAFWTRLCRESGKKLEKFHGKVPGLWRVAPFCESPRREIQNWLGLEDFNHADTWKIMTLPPQTPDILHCHNLHGGYFDLRALPRLSRQTPTILTLHDAWLMSGHCAHSLDCERWKTGCGVCPDLNIYPGIQRDATAYNWKRKKKIFEESRFYISTPSDWLMRKLHQSILEPSVIEARVIPNGVDTVVFRPGDQQKARIELDIPLNARVLLFAANGVQRNVWKDYETMKKAIALVGSRGTTKRTIFIALGEAGSPQSIAGAELRFVPFQTDTEKVVSYYQAADIYLHASRADTFPNSVLEALACGLPVIATAVGGIPEQIRGLGMECSDSLPVTGNVHQMDEATGILVPMGDANGMARAIERLLQDHLLLARMRENAVRDARLRFDLSTQIDTYLRWYEQLLRHARN